MPSFRPSLHFLHVSVNADVNEVAQQSHLRVKLCFFAKVYQKVNGYL